jgi:hypothetical protein
VDVVIPGRTCAAPGEPGKELREAGHDLDLPRGDRGPRAVRDDAGGERVDHAEAVVGDEAGVLVSLPGQVDETERAVGARLCQDPERGVDGVSRAAVHRAGQAAELLQHGHPASGEHPLGRLHDRVEQAGHLTTGLDDGAVGEGEVALLVEATPRHRQRQVLVARRPAGEDVVDHRLDVGPDVIPDVGDTSSQRGRVPQAERGGIGVVVDHHELSAPHEQHSEPGVQGGADGGAQGG